VIFKGLNPPGFPEIKYKQRALQLRPETRASKMMLSQKVLIWIAKQKAPNARRVIIEQ